MKQLVYLLAVAFFTLSINAQSPIPIGIKKSVVFKDTYKFSGIAFLESDNRGGSIIVRWYEGSLLSGKSGYLFEHYDADLKLLGTYDYPMRFNEAIHQSSVLGIVMEGENIHIIDFLYNSKKQSYSCSSITATVTDFNFVKKELFQIGDDEIGKPGFFAGKHDPDNYASMTVNKEGTAFAVSVDLKNPDYESHRLHLYDNTLDKKLEYTFKRDIKDRNFKYQNIAISKDGNAIYLLARVADKVTKGKNEGGKYRYELSKISKDTEESQSFETSEYFVGTLHAVAFEDRIACIGFYSNIHEGSYSGMGYFEFDPKSLQLRKSNFNQFTEQLMFDKFGLGKDRELGQLTLRKVLITDNNEIIFNAEEYYIFAHRYSTGATDVMPDYHLNDIVSLKINKNGELVWSRTINKDQVQGDERPFLSYTSALKADDTYFLINAFSKVDKISDDRIEFAQATLKFSDLTLLHIGKDGTFSYQKVLDHSDNEFAFMVADGIFVQKENAVYVLGQEGKKRQLLKIQL